MPRQYLSIRQIQPLSKGWTVLLQVVHLGHVQLSRGANPVNYRRILLTDSEGTQVGAVVYGTDIRYFSGMLIPYRRYYISSAMLRPVDAKYQVGDYQFSWVMNNRTLVEAYAEQVPPMLPCHFGLTEFQNLSKYADTDILQNVQGIVVRTFPSKQRSADLSCRDIVIVNEENVPMILTLWNDFDSNEGCQLASSVSNANVLIAMKLKVTTFNCLSLSTRLQTCLLINPPSTESIALSDWYKRNCEAVEELVLASAYKSSYHLLRPPHYSAILSIKEAVATLKDIKTAWIQGSINLPGTAQSFWYPACMNCHKSIDACLEWVIKCPGCKEEAGVEARCRFTIIIDDGSASIHAVISGDDAEKLIPYTVNQLKDASDHATPVFLELATSIQNQHLVCFIRHFESNYRGHKDDKFSIVAAYMDSELQSHGSMSIPETPELANKTILSSTAGDAFVSSFFAEVNSPVSSSRTCDDNSQVFTPNIEHVREPVMESTNISVAEKKSAKRKLSFESSVAAPSDVSFAENLSTTTETTSNKKARSSSSK